MHRLEDLEYIKKLDKYDMYGKTMGIPDQIQKAYFEPIIHKPKDFTISSKKIRQILVCGMGGSAIAGDIIRSYFNIDLPITVVKDYHLPFVGSETMCLFVSYSGNTEETLSCLKIASEHHAQPMIAAVTVGGKMKEMIDGKYLWLEAPAGYQPRVALAYMFFSVLKILELFTIVEDHTECVKEIFDSMKKKIIPMSVEVEVRQNIAKTAAIAIQNKIPIIYSSNPELNSVAYRWKCQINENAKQPAFHHTFPEMNHNEIVGWENKELTKNFIPIFLRRHDDEDHYVKRIEIFKELLAKNDVQFLEFFGNGTVHKDGDDEFYFLPPIINSLVFLADMTSFYLAILNGVDPTEIKYIDYMKDKLKS
ncbi:MAG: bifunctional phosphoglucose/phosphomannose isomerase [Candidatus Cloacimonetes bacterium]|nr:bifunctional phosphoglucose/phosphomannose isomerase [Candidatus Cloacimonadota bacterium]